MLTFFLFYGLPFIQAQIFSCLSPDENKEYSVIILAGQSNMVGQGISDDIDIPVLSTGICYLSFGRSGVLNGYTGEFGPELGLAAVLTDKFPDKYFILLKLAVGGSSQLDWSSEYDSLQAKKSGHPEYGSLYNQLISRLDSLRSIVECQVVAFMWMQGERDAKLPDVGRNYYKNFKNLIESLRDDLENPSLPVVFGLVNPPEENYPAAELVRAAQKKIAEDISNTVMVYTEDLEKWDDRLHYSSRGQIKLGERFGDELALLLLK